MPMESKERGKDKGWLRSVLGCHGQGKELSFSLPGWAVNRRTERRTAGAVGWVSALLILPFVSIRSSLHFLISISGVPSAG